MDNFTSLNTPEVFQHSIIAHLYNEGPEGIIVILLGQ